METTIQVDCTSLDDAILKLTTLAATIRATTLEPSFSASKGSIVTSLQTQIASLKALGENIAVLAETTAQVTQSARDTFYDTDEALAKW